MSMLRTALCLGALLAANSIDPGKSFAEGPLAGTFMYVGRPGSPEAITLSQIGPYLDELKNELQMNTVVLASSKFNLGTCNSPSFQWATGLDPALPDNQSKLLAIAQGALDRQMDLYIGLVNSAPGCDEFWGADNRENVNAQTNAAIAAIKNKLNRPGPSNPYSAVKGWYIPDEAAHCASGLSDYYQPIVLTIRSHSPRLSRSLLRIE